jgi:alcohol dehydrogenase (quinone), cytochrome c subunit
MNNLRLIGFLTILLTASLPPLAHAEAADRSLVQLGQYLARLGDCFACHTAPQGKPFAGGLPMNTPMGTIYSTNITPDRVHGIGTYSEAEFANALRKGIAQDGHNLYPAMPYPSFSKLDSADIKALYAYFMLGVAAVPEPNKPATIPFPLNMRWPLKLWNLVFLPSASYVLKPERDAVWNRGAYLVQGLGHCGACHSPRGVAFQELALDEQGLPFLSGGVLDGWSAPNLTGNENTGLGRWDEHQLASFLRTGTNAQATAFGSMTSVINNSTQYLNDADVVAVSRYLKSLRPAKPAEVPVHAYADAQTSRILRANAGMTPGADTYAEFCIHCHAIDGRGNTANLAPLAGNPNVLDPDPSSLIQVVLNGSDTLVIKGLPAPYPMPGFSRLLNDQQISDVLSFVRSGWNNNSAPVPPSAVAKIRKDTAPN